jgi:Mad3/BUB1 homology region 2
VNLEAIYVDSEEFSFEELLAKKRGIYGLRFEVEKPKSPIENIFIVREPVSSPSTENPRLPFNSQTSTKQSPLQEKPISKSPSPPLSPTIFTNDENDVFMPIRGTNLLLNI